MNSMKQANEKNQEWKDARDVGKALIDYCHGQEPSHRFTPTTILDLRAFAKFYAQRCGVVFTESINQEWKDSRDVYKALSDFVMEKNRTLPMHDADWLEFAQYFAQRCGVVLDSECDHPYHSVVGGNGRPERCLKCGKILSD